ncbi:MAG: two-component regulator propeller domain-containing protein [Inhella sp.]
MRAWRQPLIVALLLLLASGLAPAQPEPSLSPLEPQFASIPVPRDVVGSLAQDRQGFIWVGTLGQGLARYDPATRRFEPQELPAQAAAERRVLAVAVAGLA